MTSPDPSGAGEDQYGTARKITRIMVVVSFAGPLFDIAREFATLDRTTSQVLKIIGGVATIIGVTGTIAQLHYYERIARRIPDPALSARARFLKKAMATCVIVKGVEEVAVALLAAPSSKIMTGPIATPVFIAMFVLSVGLIAGAALLVFTLIELQMVWRFNRRFGAQLRLARFNWKLAGAVPTP